MLPRMRIEQFDPAADGARLQALYRVVQAASAVDDPNGPRISLPLAHRPETAVRGLMQGGRSFVGSWSLGLDGHPQQTWLACGDDGEPVGGCVLELPQGEEARIALCFVVVSPGERRRGTGSALLAHCRAQARSSGRALLVGETRQPSSGSDFAQAAGARRGGTIDQRRVLDVDAGLPPRLDELRAGAELRASGYTLSHWSGPATDGDLDEVAAVVEAVADAPRPGSMQAERWDAARVRAAEQRAVGVGLTVRSVVARHDASGELAALTQVCLDPALPGWAFQLLTAVQRPHRGHSLGLLVKTAMHQWLATDAPGVHRIMTTNDASNAHMIAINDRLGYRVTDTFVSWEMAVNGAGAVNGLPSLPDIASSPR
jgi:GNAT superfamily N-acetyltransferase